MAPRTAVLLHFAVEGEIPLGHGLNTLDGEAAGCKRLRRLLHHTRRVGHIGQLQ